VKKWSVTVLVDASVTVEVEAETAEEARELALGKAETPGLCHYCSNSLDVGDPYRAMDPQEIK